MTGTMGRRSVAIDRTGNTLAASAPAASNAVNPRRRDQNLLRNGINRAPPFAI
jgi:hypothetical protein